MNDSIRLYPRESQDVLGYHQRNSLPIRQFVAPIAASLVLTLTLAGQSAVPRTPDGQPDLQGTWSYATMTPLERPKELARKPLFTKAEAEAYERAAPARDLADLPPLERKLNADLVGDFATLDVGHLDPSLRTSLIVDPPNGVIPPLTRQAKARKDARSKARKLPPDGPEAMRSSDWCLHDVAGPPLLPTAYNNFIQIVQTSDYVMIETEMIHDARIIPLDGRPHLPATFREWNGDSRGRWDGDTLVIDTTNFRAPNALTDATAALHVVERLTRVDERSLRYEFSVTDPGAFTKPWAGAYTIHTTQAPMYEFACHEGNYSIAGMLRGARAQEKITKRSR